MARSVAKGSDYKLYATCRGHSSYVRGIDFSADGCVMRSCCGANEVLYLDVKSGRPNACGRELRDVVWESVTCVLGWSVMNIWPPCSDGTDVNACSAYGGLRGEDGGLLVTADDHGLLKLFRHPACVSGQSYRAYVGHSSHVLACTFSKDGRTVWSGGGSDCSIMQVCSCSPVVRVLLLLLLLVMMVAVLMR